MIYAEESGNDKWRFNWKVGMAAIRSEGGVIEFNFRGQK
jgi:hypothetical protein